MKMRTTLKIKGKVWKVKQVPNLRDLTGQPCMGLCVPSRRLILIDSELKGRELRATYLHELNHAILFELHILLDGTVEEVVVEGFADVYNDLL